MDSFGVWEDQAQKEDWGYGGATPSWAFLMVGVGAIFVWGDEGILGAYRGPKMAEWAPKNHNLACLHLFFTLFNGIHFTQFLVLRASNQSYRDYWGPHGAILVYF